MCRVWFRSGAGKSPQGLGSNGCGFTRDVSLEDSFPVWSGARLIRKKNHIMFQSFESSYNGAVNYLRPVIRPVARFMARNLWLFVVALFLCLGAGHALADGGSTPLDPTSGLTTGVVSATTIFNAVATLSIGALVFAMIMKFSRRGGK